jgi:hypothetical protein
MIISKFIVFTAIKPFIVNRKVSGEISNETTVWSGNKKASKILSTPIGTPSNSRSI